MDKYDDKIRKLREKIDEAKKAYDYKKVFLETGRLINLLNKKKNKLLSESKGAMTPEIRRLLNDTQKLLRTHQQNLVLYYDKCMSDENIKKNNKDLSKIRGQYIKFVEKEIKRLSENPAALSDEDKAFLYQLQTKYPKLLSEHKQVLSTRINDEVIKSNTQIWSPIIVLPKAIKLSIQNISACIKDIKNAKDNKEKKKKILDAAKAVGLGIAAPVIFAGKFLLSNWAVILGIYLSNGLIKGLNGMEELINKIPGVNFDVIPDDLAQLFGDAIKNIPGIGDVIDKVTPKR